MYGGAVMSGGMLGGYGMVMPMVMPVAMPQTSGGYGKGGGNNVMPVMMPMSAGYMTVG